MRICPFCRDQHGATLIHDSTERRAYECGNCGALDYISKGKASWWYHGWQALDRGPGEPGDRIDGDGKRARAPMLYLERAKLATGGNLDLLTFA